MKITIDTTKKTITLDENIPLFELCELMKNMFPNDKWKDYILVQNIKINIEPQIIPYTPYIPYTPTTPINPLIPNIVYYNNTI
jgi:hypothetical protein